MIIDHQKTLTAIELDGGTDSYNLTGEDPESLEDSSVHGNPGIVRFAGGFDGPRNIATFSPAVKFLRLPISSLRQFRYSLTNGLSNSN